MMTSVVASGFMTRRILADLNLNTNNYVIFTIHET